MVAFRVLKIRHYCESLYTEIHRNFRSRSNRRECFNCVLNNSVERTFVLTNTFFEKLRLFTEICEVNFRPIFILSGLYMRFILYRFQIKHQLIDLIRNKKSFLTKANFLIEKISK